ncbi:dihydroorotate dehydrogenase-like protein [bacterium]|nr:dihydroorotate dehydrogenase-like protein [bacterium]
MPDLSTSYMGLTLRNPLLVASSGLTKTAEGVKKCADAGAGAVVLKSLFEEQIEIEPMGIIEKHLGVYQHAEAFEYVRRMGMELGPYDYLRLIEEARRSTDIPIIASLNCISPRWWVDYARQIESAGAHALELNISMIPTRPNITSEQIEEQYFTILDGVKKGINIPIAVKIGPYFTSMARVANELSKRGADALVIFNRFYQPDFDIDKMDLTYSYQFSSPAEIHFPLRWIALLAGNLKTQIAASTGIHDGAGAVKYLLAGATVTQLCSVLYKQGLVSINQILDFIQGWMEQHNFQNLGQMRGIMSQKLSNKPEAYERLQYIKALTGIE